MTRHQGFWVRTGLCGSVTGLWSCELFHASSVFLECPEGLQKPYGVLRCGLSPLCLETSLRDLCRGTHPQSAVPPKAPKVGYVRASGQRGFSEPSR